MERPYIEELRIENYGCIQDATFRLTPLHALIGPNDSGKSTVLRALKTLSYVTTFTRRGGQDPRVQDALLSVAGPNKGKARLEVHASTERYVLEPFKSGWSSPLDQVASALNATLLRLDPDFLRKPNALIPDGQPLRFTDERGTGLAALYDALVVRDLAAYAALNEQLTRLFPSVKSIQLGNPTATTKAIGVKLTDGSVIPAELMSEGLLYYLAFAILPYLDPTALLLIEEPENGLHPARIAEVMRVLRAISDKTQVILATHSPLVINELRPEEVTVVTRSKEHGTKATLLKDTPNFEERAKVYALGELWLSYANGEDEAPLLQGGPRP
jgi:predicted ATPase